MVYEFRYGGYTYDVKTTEELPTAIAVKKHAKKVAEKNKLPYVTISERSL